MNQLLSFSAVYLQDDFVNGQHNRDFSVDTGFLTDDEIDAISTWVYDVLNRRDHKGKNKPSYVDSAGKLADDSIEYVKAGAWHYHCGPTFQRPSGYNRITEWNLPMNLNGLGSEEIVHYSQKTVPGKIHPSITVFGYSRGHMPFRSSTAKDNPLRARMTRLHNSVDWYSVFGPDSKT